jgi:hypothetical protein
MAEIFHIPTDGEVGLGQQNCTRRALFFRACALCKQDYEIRDGHWISTHTKIGTEIKILICAACHSKETQ